MIDLCQITENLGRTKGFLFSLSPPDTHTPKEPYKLGLKKGKNVEATGTWYSRESTILGFVREVVSVYLRTMGKALRFCSLTNLEFQLLCLGQSIIVRRSAMRYVGRIKPMDTGRVNTYIR